MRFALSLLASALVTSIYAQVPNYVSTDNLVGWWPFSGNANDESGNGNNGTVNGAILTLDRNGVVDAAYSFNGLSDFIETTAMGPIDTTARSFAFWVRTDNDAHQAPIDYYGGSGGGFQPILNNPCPGLGVDAGTGVVTRGDATLINGNWHHCALVFDPASGSTISSVAIYIDGVVQGSIACSALDPNALVNTDVVLPVLFGKTTSDVRYLDGDLDDVGIWNRALAPCEIQALYNAGNQGVSPTPVSYTGLNSSYTITDPPSALLGTPSGGVFIGTGVTGNTFDPSVAGVGTHTVMYLWTDECGLSNAAGICTDVTLSVGDGGGNLATGGGVRVFPNPNRGQFTVELELKGLVSMQVFDTRGRMVHNEVFQGAGNRTIRNLDLSTLAKGAYTLQVQNSGGTTSLQVVVE